MEPVLTASRVSGFYGTTQVLFDIDFTVQPSSITTMIGANGAGKTSVLKTICGLLKSSGSIKFSNIELLGRSTESIAALGIAFVPEGRGTISKLTVRENLLVGTYLLSSRKAVNQTLADVYAMFPLLKLKEGVSAQQLSGGEQQILALARALMSKPKLLLLNEPSLGVSPIVTSEIFKILHTLVEDRKIAVLMNEQNVAAALKNSTYVYLMESGRIKEAGTPARLAASISIADAYLGA